MNQASRGGQWITPVPKRNQNPRRKSGVLIQSGDDFLAADDQSGLWPAKQLVAAEGDHVDAGSQDFARRRFEINRYHGNDEKIYI